MSGTSLFMIGNDNLAENHNNVLGKNSATADSKTTDARASNLKYPNNLSYLSKLNYS